MPTNHGNEEGEKMSEDKKRQTCEVEVKPITLQEANNISQTSNGSYNNDYVKMYNTFKAYLEASKVVEELKKELNKYQDIAYHATMEVEGLDQTLKDVQRLTHTKRVRK